MDEEIKFEEDKRQNKKINIKFIMYILILLCLILLVCLIISIRNNSKLKENKSVDIPSTNPKVEVMDVTSEEVQGLFNNTIGTISNYCLKDKSFFTDGKVDISFLSDDIVYGIIMNKIVNVDKISGNISRRLVKDEISKLFGEKYRYENSDVVTYPNYDFVDDSATYVLSEDSKPFSPTVCDLYRVVKAYKQDDDFYIYVRVLFVSSDNNKIQYYGDYGHSKELNDLETNSNGALLANENNFSKGELYEMKYSLDANDNYLFVYSMPVN